MKIGTWAEKQMYQAGLDYWRHFLTPEDAIWAYGPYFTTLGIRKAFMAGIKNATVETPDYTGKGE